MRPAGMMLAQLVQTIRTRSFERVRIFLFVSPARPGMPRKPILAHLRIRSGGSVQSVS
jgi:hypothetical protein